MKTWKKFFISLIFTLFAGILSSIFREIFNTSIQEHTNTMLLFLCMWNIIGNAMGGNDEKK